MRTAAPVDIGSDAMPAAFPVKYAVIGREIYFRTAVGTKLAAAVNRTVVAFQADEFDAASATGWSVLVVGPARLVTDPDERALLDRAGIHSWVVADPPHYVAIGMDRITGRPLQSAATAAGPALTTAPAARPVR